MVYFRSSLVDILMILVLCLSVFSKYGAGENYTNVSEEEIIEIEKQLKILNKPPIKTIITKMGDTIDCINIYEQPSFDHPSLKNHKIQYVSVETPLNTRTIYHGAIDSFGIHTPSVTPDQYSTSQMWIQNGEAEQTNIIEGGWAVYPELFGDHATRFFTHWTIGSQILFGAVFNPQTAYGTEVLSTVNMDEDTRNWWIYIGDDQRAPIRYWPSEIFTYLPAASLIRFGGIAGARKNTPSPPMGTKT
ncbi:uncharacterized protein LOC113324640 [Papaver somniferum]|uniref:uncharacterized protein LOC113324640 n=1 Tax=Papaver somniferum TaxID=3469 RepID=UPI000E6F9DD9|nr:uncharacterized protein LOC113324640 [Papaver somniferum]